MSGPVGGASITKFTNTPFEITFINGVRQPSDDLLGKIFAANPQLGQDIFNSLVSVAESSPAALPGRETPTRRRSRPSTRARALAQPSIHLGSSKNAELAPNCASWDS
jgi:hypothetical protein